MKKSLFIFVLSLISLLFYGCENIPVIWEPTFDSTDKQPYGTYILRNELGNLFSKTKIKNIREYTIDYISNVNPPINEQTYMFIYPNQFHDSETYISILTFVNRGGSAFISNREMDSIWQEHLGIKLDSIKHPNSEIAVKFSVKTKKQQEKSNILSKGVSTRYIKSYDPETTEVLGYVEFNGQKHPNFIKIYHGYGYILYHTEPYAFTNYHMLREDNYKYVTDVLSYIQSPTLLWDNHRLYGRDSISYNNGGFFNALKFILQHESLRWALYLLVFTGILYLIVNAKRKQNPIPIIEPYQNVTLGFAQTLSELYKYNADHTAITKYRINYFLEQLKSHYHISAKDLETDFSKILSAKSGVDLYTCEKLYTLIDIYRNRTYLDKEDFFKLHTLIQNFNQNSATYGRTNSK